MYVNKNYTSEEKNMKYISNAFSPKMLNPKTNPNFIIKETTLNEINKNKEDLISAIGHNDVSRHVHIKKQRINIQLEKYDILYIVQKSIENNNEYNYKKMIITS